MRELDGLCGYNPTVVELVFDPKADCREPIRWHVLGADPDPFLFADGEPALTPPMYQACDAHLRYALCAQIEVAYHEVGPWCGKPNSYWIIEQDTCVDEETAIEIGALELAEEAEEFLNGL